jgi:hypothetical protein
MLALAGVYLAPAFLNVVLWIGQPPITAIGFMLASGCGPLLVILLLMPVSWALRCPAAFPPVLFGLTWTIWFLSLRSPRLRRLRYAAHAAIALVWWLVGTLFVIIGIAA